MQPKKSTVTAVIPSEDGGYEGEHGWVNTFIYTFEDGTSGEAGHKTEHPKFKVGETVSYTTKEHPTHGTKISFVKDPNSSYTPKPTAKKDDSFSPAGMAMRFAVDFTGSMMKARPELAQIDSETSGIKTAMFKMADDILAWINKNNK